MNCQIDGASLPIMKLINATRQQRLQKGKNLIKQFAKPRGSVVDALIVERR